MFDEDGVRKDKFSTKPADKVSVGVTDGLCDDSSVV